VLLRHADPRLDPRLRPDQWVGASRRRRWLLLLTGLTGLTLVGVSLVFTLIPMDRTKGLEPEEIAHAAGRAILDARRFGFTLFLDGEIPEQGFPTTAMSGQFQREPPVLHLVGAVGMDESRVPLEYYLDGLDLFVKDIDDGTWRMIHDPDFEELRSYQPEALALPLTSGLQRATLVGRETLASGEAIVLKLDLLDHVMPIDLGQGVGRLDYTVWVDTRKLYPARESSLTIMELATTLHAR
jgi:hypothetical protein